MPTTSNGAAAAVPVLTTPDIKHTPAPPRYPKSAAPAPVNATMAFERKWEREKFTTHTYTPISEPAAAINTTSPPGPAEELAANSSAAALRKHLKT